MTDDYKNGRGCKTLTATKMECLSFEPRKGLGIAFAFILEFNKPFNDSMIIPFLNGWNFEGSKKYECWRGT